MASLRSKFEEHLTCSVCLEQLRDPKVLPCLHSFCHECIVKLARNAKSKDIACPECRMAVTVDDPQNLSDLPSNFFVNNLLATMSLTDDETAKKIPCDNCDSGDVAETRCKDCGIFLCHFCTESHRRSRATKLHELVSIDELKSVAVPESFAEKIRCTKHKEEVIKLFCKTCRTTICRDCTIVDHQQHKYEFIEEVAFQEKQNLQENINEVKLKKVRLVQGISNLKKFDEGLTVKKKSLTSEINYHFDELSKLIESRKRELLEKANSLISVKEKQIYAQLEQLEMTLASCESSIEFTEQAFEHGNNVQILSMEKYILQSLENLKSVEDQTQPCVTEHIVFVIPSSFEETRNRLFNSYVVDDIVVSPESCEAFFSEPQTELEPGKQSTIKVVCNDQNNKRLTFGGQLIEPTFAGVEVSDITVTDNEDGSYNVKFCPHQGGLLKFGVTINGQPAPGCSLTERAKWVINSAVGKGEITNNGLTMTGEGQDGNYCYRIGGCCFDSGVHMWIVQCRLRHPMAHLLYQFTRPLPIAPRYMVEVGVIDYDDVKAGDVSNPKSLWVYKHSMFGNQSLSGANISLELDMESRKLKITLRNDFGRNSGHTQNCQLTTARVTPYFACSSPHVSLTIRTVQNM